jgi:hypothetical protein
VIAAHAINGDSGRHFNRRESKAGPEAQLFVVLGLKNFLAAVKPGRTDVMTTMHFAGGRLDRRGRIRQKVVRTVHPALRRRLLVLLDSHG